MNTKVYVLPNGTANLVVPVLQKRILLDPELFRLILVLCSGFAKDKFFAISVSKTEVQQARFVFVRQKEDEFLPFLLKQTFFHLMRMSDVVYHMCGHALHCKFVGILG